jgi:hypothetical protein
MRRTRYGPWRLLIAAPKVATKARTRSSTWPRGLMMGADNVFGKKD